MRQAMPCATGSRSGAADGACAAAGGPTLELSWFPDRKIETAGAPDKPRGAGEPEVTLAADCPT